ncbi:16S rRNA (uracil(1498)-N(3))-methyltransferase [Sandaracinobacteroides saxicola]|uniref:Ribosomal RNA small subunit methyltransferase E n=1 Tax=Sandaracinobacteroides saxicola TaxID=2759707 RepID=A0A7G5IDQ6_9SPHN|nr:16S rRNA (uracil(1498)-N(3))-methyltransferase [Sandaracinobacteroides saxicola]QMW21498.1 16S rRNA (uracil(1498)-N(3))-methyltransferase [Sandaracinobacteroides saxicola]
MRQIPRLFVETPLVAGSSIVLEGAQAHYLLNVLRLDVGAQMLLCDDIGGEFRALVAVRSKRVVQVDVVGRERAREMPADLWLCVAPIKGPRWDWVAEKACELGVARLVPVQTRRTVVTRVNGERLRAHMIEAAEQCGRTALPTLGELTPLANLLAGWPADRALIFADEGGGAPAASLSTLPPPAAILIGPEGGFAPEEREAIRALPQAHAIGLGPRILRADTAAVAAVALWQSHHGD